MWVGNNFLIEFQFILLVQIGVYVVMNTNVNFDYALLYRTVLYCIFLEVYPILYQVYKNSRIKTFTR